MVRALAAVLVLLLAPQLGHAVTVGDYPTGYIAGGIGFSRHNMGSTGRVLTTGATSEICVFCHTPHSANSAVAPLWNKSTAASSSYSAYGTTSAGSQVTAGTLGGTTLACLSCHDGVSTFDSIINAPGKGGISPAGPDRNWTFFMPDKSTSSVDFDHFDTSGGGMGGGGMGSGCSSMMCHPSNPAIRLSVGMDLSDDHPVSIPYNESLTIAGLRPTATVISTIDLVSELSGSADLVFSGNLAQNRWAVNGAVTDAATIGDLLRDGRVECTSCHDPHFRNLSWDEVEDSWGGWSWCDGGGGGMGGGMGGGGGGGGGNAENCTDGNFLRRIGGNTGSAMCRTCHNK